ncbi:hypothetical protein ACFSX9_01325 [Flavobacterium ardleyense]|uniref:Lipoprotein n=1 Tax=Flavobacterium ardleyense TaxID=2038737 RepID=A0ABW5Z688_9FLAO
MKKLVVCSIILFITASCATRLITPAVEGNVYDINNNPLTEVKVCLNDECKVTNEEGYFVFKMKVKKEFAMIGGEAPAVIYNLRISKKMYNDTIIYYKNLYGGSNIDQEIKYKSIILKSNN